MKGILFIFFLCIIVGVGAVGFFEKVNAQQTESTTSYINQSVGIELRYSSLWTKEDEKKPDGTLLLLKTKTDEKVRVRKSTLNSTYANLDSYVHAFLVSLKKKHTILSSKKTTIKGYPAYTLVYSFTPSSKNPKYITQYVDTVILRDRELLSVTYFGFPANFTTSYKDVKKILSSLTFSIPKKSTSSVVCDSGLPKEWQKDCVIY